jgi:hypothetical protein
MFLLQSWGKEYEELLLCVSEGVAARAFGKSTIRAPP